MNRGWGGGMALESRVGGRVGGWVGGCNDLICEKQINDDLGTNQLI